MAKLNQQQITITLSKLLRNNEEEEVILDQKNLEDLLSILQQLLGDDILIETDIQ